MAVVSLSDPVTPTSSTFFLGHPMHVFPNLRDLSIYSMRPTTSTSFLVAPIHCLANDVHLSNRFHHDIAIYSMRPTSSTSFLVAPIHCLANDVHLSNSFHHDARSMLSTLVFVFLSETELVSL